MSIQYLTRSIFSGLLRVLLDRSRRNPALSNIFLAFYGSPKIYFKGADPDDTGPGIAYVNMSVDKLHFQRLSQYREAFVYSMGLKLPYTGTFQEVLSGVLEREKLIGNTIFDDKLLWPKYYELTGTMMTHHNMGFFWSPSLDLDPAFRMYVSS